MKIVGREDLIEEPWFRDHTGRVEHADELDAIIQDWIGRHTTGGGAGGVRRARGRDRARQLDRRHPRGPPVRGAETVTTVEHPRLGPVRMQNVIPTLSETPGRIDHAGGR